MLIMDGTEKRTDALQATVDPSGVARGTSQTDLEKAVSDALAKAGRDAKTLEAQQAKLEKDAADLTAKQIAWQRQREEEEEEAVADDMPALQALRDRRARKAAEESKASELAERESKLAKRETELADMIERDRTLQRTQLASEIAVEKGVSLDAILKLAKADTREAMEEVAAVLPKEIGKHPPMRSAPGETLGGGEISEQDKLKRRYPSMYKK